MIHFWFLCLFFYIKSHWITLNRQNKSIKSSYYRHKKICSYICHYFWLTISHFIIPSIHSNEYIRYSCCYVVRACKTEENLWDILQLHTIRTHTLFIYSPIITHISILLQVKTLLNSFIFCIYTQKHATVMYRE